MVLRTVLVPREAMIEGRIETGGDVRVDGHVAGEIEAGGSVIVSKGAICRASIQAGVAEIYGELIGNALCVLRIRVAAGARVVGDLCAPDVEVDAEAEVDGRVDLDAPAPDRHTVRRLPPSTTGVPPMSTLAAAPSEPVATAQPQAPATAGTAPNAPLASSPTGRPVGRPTGRPTGRSVPRPPRPRGRVRVRSGPRSN